MIFDGFFNLIGSSLTNSARSHEVDKTNWNNLKIARETNALNKQLQQEQWNRDDTSYQRMVQDMSAAGLNPLAGSSGPVSSPMSAQMQGAEMQAASFETPRFTFDDGVRNLVSAIQSQEELNLQKKRLNLAAIQSGVSPNALDSSDSSEIVDLHRSILQSTADEMRKAANSGASRNSGPLHKTYNDMRTILRDVDSYIQSKSGHSLSDIKKSLSDNSSAGRVERKAADSYASRVQEYYYNKSHSNKSSKGRALGNFLRAKVFKR